MNGTILNRKEIWKYIPGYEGIYAVSHLGRVKRCTREVEYIREHPTSEIVQCKMTLTDKYLKPFKGKYGQLYVQLRKDGKVHQLSLTKIVADTFIPNPENYKYIKHLDFDITNNLVSNLKRVKTHQELRPFQYVP